MSMISVQELANSTLREVLQTQYDGEAAAVIKSPPGAGKTGLVQRLAVQNMVLLGERCALATQTNQQAFDLARRCARDYPGLSFTLMVRRGLAQPADHRQLAQPSGRPVRGDCKQCPLVLAR